ncbi:1-deoxy-D-xylulose-5-phosphate synthase [Candidatus Poribacteria bacterium]
MSILERIDSPENLKDIDIDELEELAEEIRQKIISVVSETGGHLASNLGVVELTIAIHSVFDIGNDKIVWDVGHQCYTHKILTGRSDCFHTIRQYGGLSGFPKIHESEYDDFGTGHASTAISAALGMALARDLKGESSNVLAVVGDGALTGGIAFEALNHAGHARTDLIIVFNDNEMSISPTIGGLSRRINRLRTAPIYNRVRRDTAELVSRFGPLATQLAHRIDDSARALLVDGMLFESLELRHFGPIDGHDLPLLIETFNRVKDIQGPIIVHVVTKKGKGYSFAEENPTKFHSASPFDVSTGENIKKKKISYTDAFSDALIKLATEDERIVPITAAMPNGTGVSKFMEKFPDRCFDVGIAEQHAVTLAAGLASQGMRPIVTVYSTFLQRAYDQIIHDVCLQNLPVTFALDRAGLVGADGPTHHGTFDYAYLRHIPNIVIMAPKDEVELQHMLKTAIEWDGPAALRYPRSAGIGVPLPQELTSLTMGKAELLQEGQDVLLLAIGSMVYPAMEAAEMLSGSGVSAAVVNARFVKPIDRDLILPLIQNLGKVVTIEEHALRGGFGSAISEMLIEENAICGVQMGHMGIPDRFVEHGDRERLLQMNDLTPDGILQFTLKMLAPDENARSIPKIRRTVSATR